MVGNKRIIRTNDQPEAYQAAVIYDEITVEVLQGIVRAAVTITARDNCS